MHYASPGTGSDPRLKESLAAILQPLMERTDLSLIPAPERLRHYPMWKEAGPVPSRRR